MPSTKLIGTAADQIPTNADLGSLAFQDREAINFLDGRGGLQHLDVTTFNQQFDVSATDVFVYDTSKDSDGGAWRNRCQHTSWYNEDLNTATRGARRDFPSVAVIVVTATSVTIYDGDDSTLPMWMVFDTTNIGGVWSGDIVISNFDMLSGGSGSSAVMLNATLVWGCASNLITVNFINERSVYRGSTANTDGVYRGTIAQRHSNSGHYEEANLGLIVNASVQDIAIAVMPNAPTDVSTGLPVPTIAVGTLGGVSLLKHDGTIIYQTNSNWLQCFGVKIIDGVLYAQQGNYYWYAVDLSAFTSNINTANDKFGSYGGVYPTHRNIYPDAQYQYLFNSTATPARGTYNFALMCSNGYNTPVNNYLQLIASNPAAPESGMTSIVTTKYQTGWMHGSIKGAWLTDTTAETITASPNLISNSDISNGTTNWSTGNSGTLSVSNGQLIITGNGGNFPSAKQVVSVTPGKQYLVQVDMAVVSGSAGAVLEVYNGSWTTLATNSTTTMTTYYAYVTAVGSTLDTRVTIYSASNLDSSYSAKLDNMVVKQLEESRAIGSAQGLQVFGTISKTPVAAGADIVAYSGFSGTAGGNTNYLAQPYNSSLDFGTGDFCFIGWARSDSNNASTQSIVTRGGSSERGVQIWRTTSNGASYNNSLYIQVTTSTDNTIVSQGIANTTMLAGMWNQIAVVRRNGIVYAYFNGVQVYSAINTGTLNPNGTPQLLFGANNTTSNEMSLALWRISATAPTEDQVRKMYRDEKVLFQDNAKATLYGTSNQVTGLAYDEDTNLLHAGTSSGRSIFNGLRRVDNTTTAVSNSVSAANGLVAEN